MSEKYIETVENSYHIPPGTYSSKWYKRDIPIFTMGHSYSVRTTRSQDTPDVPVYLVVTPGLIDIYLGQLED